MKKYIIDKILFLIIGLLIMIAIPTFCTRFFTVILEFLVLLCWGYLCRRVLFIPLDMVLGKLSQYAYFSSQCSVESLEFFRKEKYNIYKFRLGESQTIMLLAPFAIKVDATDDFMPPKDIKLKITYYRFSGILIKWEQAEKSGDGSMIEP